MGKNPKNQSLLMSISNSTHKRPPVSSEDEAYRYTLPFYSLDRIERIYSTNLLCPTEDMLADTLTKALPSPKVKHFTVELGLVLV